MLAFIPHITKTRLISYANVNFLKIVTVKNYGIDYKKRDTD